jgi:hypothetical protein
MEKVIHKLINEFTEGVDTYTYNGSAWLIFTESKQWVIELTDSKTLWYNYNFFKSVFSYTSMDVLDNQQYITKWVEDNIINKVNDTRLEINITEGEVDDIIQDGVKETSSNVMMFQSMKVEDTIKNGVKEIYEYKGHRWDVKDVIQDGVRDISPMTQYTDWQVEEIIENGVKDTRYGYGTRQTEIEDSIENGVRHTLNTEYMPTSMVEDIIQSGVKHTEYGDWLDGDERLDDIIENGVKKTSLKRGTRPFMVKDTIKNGVKRSLPESFVDSSTIIDIIQNGVKETKTPGNGDIASTAEWMKENNSTSYPKMIDDIIENGEKINGTYAGGQRQSEKCKSVVEYGTKNPSV